MPISFILQFQLTVETSAMTVAGLKTLIKDRFGFSRKRQSIFFQGEELTDGATLADFGVALDSTLILTVGDPVDDSDDEEEGSAAAQAYGGIQVPRMFNRFVQGNWAGPVYGSHHNQANADGSYYYGPVPYRSHYNQPILNHWEASASQQYDSAIIEDLPERIDIYVMRGESNVLTVINMGVSQTVYKLKEEINNILGHEILKQRLDDGHCILHDHTMIRDIPTLIESRVVFLAFQ